MGGWVNRVLLLGLTTRLAASPRPNFKGRKISNRSGRPAPFQNEEASLGAPNRMHFVGFRGAPPPERLVVFQLHFSNLR